MKELRKRQNQDEANCNMESGDNFLRDKDMLKDKDSHGLHGDRTNIAILFFLYLLQGIPLGLAHAIPMMLQNHGVSYKQQAEFSLVSWPFSLKLLWAPIVDSIWSPKFGRRKSWMVPSQYLIGIFMLIVSSRVDRWLDMDGSEPQIAMLTAAFFMLNFLAATQDIAVDGWALTMLKRRNVGHASTCNSVGQTAGYFLGYVAFMALESEEFCNNYLRSEAVTGGLVTLSGFLWFWGLVFLVCTTLVAILKQEENVNERRTSESYFDSKEKKSKQDCEPQYDIRQAYSLLWDILKLKPIRSIAVILLTAKVAFSACDAVTSLKLVESGIPKEKLALLAVPLVPLQIVLPLAISRYTTGNRPMDIYITAIPPRLIFGLVAAALVYVTPLMLTADGQVPYYYYVLLLLSYCFHQVSLYCMFVAVMAFFARISDPTVGGTYMTLLNTLTNLGNSWPATLSLALIDSLTWRGCDVIPTNTCETTNDKQVCGEAGGNCNVFLDGYYVESLACVVFGVLWLRWCSTKIRYLQSLDLNEWKIVRSRTQKSQR